jgi:DNA-binding NtrC family response regulator/CHASE2 domain-containing sensor protein
MKKAHLRGPRRRGLAVTIGLIATLVAVVGGWASHGSVAAIDSATRDAWVPALAPVSPAVVVIARDASSEARFGGGTWDRAIVARIVTAVAQAGAAAIGVDIVPGRPGVPGRGGAASDALLAQAIAGAGNVVFMAEPGIPSAPPAAGAPAIGHMVVVADPDGVVRRVPLSIQVGERDVPALGLAVAAVGGGGAEAMAERIPTDGAGRAILRWAPDLPVLPISEVWTAIESGGGERLQKLVEGKRVLLVTEPPATLRRTPIGPLSDIGIQVELLNAALTGAWLRPAPLAWTLGGMLLVAVIAAGLGLILRGVLAVAGLALLALALAALVSAGAVVFGVALPIVQPFAALALAGIGAFVWNQVSATRRLRRLEGEVAGIREHLVRQESTVETLEEDLEAARAVVARSTGAERGLLEAADALRGQLAAATAHEEQTRLRLHALERELRAADRQTGAPGDAEQERLRRRCQEVGIITRDPALLVLFRDLERAARTTLPILLTGEPGTGKELFARAAHRLSPRASGPFVAVNMAAIPPDLFESEMFGHTRGSFTGAVADRRGHFEQAAGGTIFLDEIGETRPEHQGKLLRVLQERTLQRVGAAQPTAVDVRVVAASNRDLERGVAEGWFREDLYFRLKGVVLRLPPLRERRQDVAPLATRFVEEAAGEVGRRATLSEAALLALERHAWPGNVRELSNCLRRAVALADREVLTAADLRLDPPGSAPVVEPSGDAAVLDSLRRHGFDMQATAGALGWDRSTVTQRLKGLGFRALVESGGDRAKAALGLAGDPALAHTVEMKLAEYHEHLLRSVAGFDSAEAAIAACRRRFKNLPDRHFRSLEALVRETFPR